MASFFRERRPRVFLLAFLCVPLFFLLRTAFAPSPAAKTAPAEKPLPAVSPPAAETTSAERVRRNQTLSTILLEHGIRPGEAGRAVESFKSVCPPLLFPGQEYFLERGADSTLFLFKLRSRDRLTLYRVARKDGAYFSEAFPLFLRLDTLLVSGVMLTTLYEAMTLAGEKPELIIALTDIFSWDINWFADPKAGDVFSVVFEKKYCAAECMGYGRILCASYRNNGKTHLAYLFNPDSLINDYFDEEGGSLRRSLLKAPLAFSRVSSRFSYGRFHPVLKCRRPHLGVDYVAPAGTPVKAAGDGRVLSAVSQGGYGNCVHIRHDNSYSTLYGHLSRFAAGIREGIRVRQGQTIGFVGSSGLSTGPHLDYRMMRGNHFVNPLKVSMPPVTSLPEDRRGAFDSVRTRFNRLLGTGETGQLYASHQ